MGGVCVNKLILVFAEVLSKLGVLRCSKSIELLE